MEKGQNAGTAAFSPFPTMCSTLPKPNFKFWVTFILSSAKSLILDWSKISSFDNKNRGETTRGKTTGGGGGNVLGAKRPVTGFYKSITRSCLDWPTVSQRWFNSLLNHRILDQSKMKDFADDKNKCDSKFELWFGKSRKHLGKRRKCRFQKRS